MLRKNRLYFSAMLTALLSISLLFTSGAKACDEAPQTFLSLYMNSDLIVVAKFESETTPKKSNEDEYGYQLESERKLVFTKIYKGNRELRTISFPYFQYVSKSENGETVEDFAGDEYHFNLSKIQIGDEYLFFLTKNKEDGKYNVTDFVSGVKEIDKNLSLYEQNFSELEKIVAAKENQYGLLTEWIVKSIENKETREDGIGDLAESFYGLTYYDQEPQFKGKGPFVYTEDGYGIYTVGVAKHLTPAQKERVSAVLYPMLQEAWFANKPKYVDYGISAILGGINKSRLAVYTYNALQSIGKDDLERRNIVMEFLIETLGDETFANLYYSLLEIEDKISETKKSNTRQSRIALRNLNVQRETKLKQLDARYKVLQGKNFVAVKTTK